MTRKADEEDLRESLRQMKGEANLHESGDHEDQAEETMPKKVNKGDKYLKPRIHYLEDDGDGGVVAPCGVFSNQGAGDGTTDVQRVTCRACQDGQGCATARRGREAHLGSAQVLGRGR